MSSPHPAFCYPLALKYSLQIVLVGFSLFLPFVDCRNLTILVYLNPETLLFIIFQIIKLYLKRYRGMCWFWAAGCIWSVWIKSQFLLIFSHNNCHVLQLRYFFFTSNSINKINFIQSLHFRFSTFAQNLLKSSYGCNDPKGIVLQQSQRSKQHIVL